jgi:hypothetical protein
MNPYCAMSKEDWDLLALGALDSAEADRLIVHLRGGCEVCGRIYQESVAVGLALGTGVALSSPSEAVEEKLKKYVKRTAVPPAVAAARGGSPWWTRMALAACLAGGGVLVGWLLPRAPEVKERVVIKSVAAVGPERVVERVVEKPVERLVDRPVDRVIERVIERPVEKQIEKTVLVPDVAAQARLAALEAELERARQALDAVRSTQNVAANEDLKQRDAQILEQRRILAEYQTVFRALDAQGVRQVELARVDSAAGQSVARALYSPQGGLLVFVHGLPRLEPEKCYQLWILRKGTPSIVSGGLLKLDGRGDAFLSSPVAGALKDATGFAITDEPAGGSVVARGRKLLFGAI